MTEDEVKAVWREFKTTGDCSVELDIIELHCDLICGKYPAMCAMCGIPELKAILGARRKSLSDRS